MNKKDIVNSLKMCTARRYGNECREKCPFGHINYCIHALMVEALKTIEGENEMKLNQLNRYGYTRNEIISALDACCGEFEDCDRCPFMKEERLVPPEFTTCHQMLMAMARDELMKGC